MRVTSPTTFTRALALVALAVAAPTSAGAAPGASPVGSELAWTAPGECPDARAVRTRIDERLGGVLDGSVASRIAIEVAREGQMLVAHIDLRAVTSDGEVRTLTSTSCDELADAVAVIVARAVAHTRVEPRVAVAPPVAPVSATADSAVARTTAPILARGPRWSIGARLATVSGVGAMPGVGWGGEVDAYVRRDSLILELGYLRWLDASTRSGPYDQLEVGLAAIDVRLGWHSPAIPIGAWLVAEDGEMSGVGNQTYDARMLASRWVAAGAGVGVEWPAIHRYGLFGALEVLDVVERARFALPDGTTLYEPSRAAARVSVGGQVSW